MKAAVYMVAGALLMSMAACSNWGGAQNSGGNVPFDNGVRTNLAQPTTCSPADATCGSGVGNPSVQSPVQKRELNVAPQ